MDRQVTMEIERMPAELAKAMLLDLSRMDLGEYPLTAEDLEEFVAYNRGNPDFYPPHQPTEYEDWLDAVQNSPDI